MSLMFIDGFDHYTSPLVKYNYARQLGSISINPAFARYPGGQGCRLRGGANYVGTPGPANDPGGTYLHKGNLAPASSVMIMAGSVLLNNTFPGIVWPPSQNSCCWTVYNDSGTGIGGLNFKQGRIHLYNYNATAYDSGYSIIPEEWFFLEFKVVAHPTSGYLIAKVNEETILSVGPTGTVAAGGNTTISQFRIAANTENIFNAESCPYWLDDFYVLNNEGANNNNFIGEWRCVTLYPNGTGSQANWEVTGAAANWDATNEKGAYNTTDYVYTSGVGLSDIYNYDNLSSKVSDVAGVQLNVVARKEGGGGATVSPLIETSSVVTSGTGTTVNATYHNIIQRWDTDPYDDTEWTRIKVNNAMCGFFVEA